MPKDNLTFEYVNDVLSYDAQTGEFTRKKGRNAGKVAGYKSKSSKSIVIGLGTGNYYQAHRLAWLLHYGTWPSTPCVDHINGDPFDNRIANLREATGRQNQGNTKLRKDNKSGYKGVQWFKQTKKWQAMIGSKHIGLYSTKEEAAAAYNEAAKNLFGVFAKE